MRQASARYGGSAWLPADKHDEMVTLAEAQESQLREFDTLPELEEILQLFVCHSIHVIKQLTHREVPELRTDLTADYADFTD